MCEPFFFGVKIFNLYTKKPFWREKRGGVVWVGEGFVLFGEVVILCVFLKIQFPLFR